MVFIRGMKKVLSGMRHTRCRFGKENRKQLRRGSKRKVLGKSHKGRCGDILPGVVDFRAGVWEVSEVLSEVDRMEQEARPHPGGLGSDSESKNPGSPPAPSGRVPKPLQPQHFDNWQEK